MRIQPIFNSNFKGKNTYNTYDNGKWSVVYNPYCWEGGNKSTIEPARYLDILSSELPNNEQMSVATFRGDVMQKEVFSDILGINTSIYDGIKDEFRGGVINGPSMNREESIKVYIKKLQKFLDMKLEQRMEWDKQIINTYNDIRELSLDFDEHSRDYDSGYFVAKNTKRENKDFMAAVKDKIIDKISSIREQESRIKQLDESSNKVKEQIIKFQKELSSIDEARKTAKIIDISRRDIENADGPLKNAMRYDFETLINSVVILPHKTISMKKIFAQMKHMQIFDIASRDKIVDYIGQIIKSAR